MLLSGGIAEVAWRVVLLAGGIARIAWRVVLSSGGIARIAWRIVLLSGCAAGVAWRVVLLSGCAAGVTGFRRWDSCSRRGGGAARCRVANGARFAEGHIDGLARGTGADRSAGFNGEGTGGDRDNETVRAQREVGGGGCFEECLPPFAYQAASARDGDQAADELEASVGVRLNAGPGRQRD
jgi:hypothetical protein